MTAIIRCLAWQFRRRGYRAAAVALLVLLVIAYLLAARSGHESQSVDFGHRRPGDTLPKVTKPMLTSPPHPPSPVAPPPPAPPKLSIPKRLHHYFGDSVAIPQRLVQSVNSWANNHRHYDVYFWNTRYLEQHVLPGLPLYTQYRRCYDAERHTVARLVILHTYGGVLVDPDLMSLRDFAPFLDGSTCVLAQERPELAALLHGLDVLPSLRFAACRPGHPFLRLFLRRFCGLVDARPGWNASDALETATAAAVRGAFDAAVAAYDDDCAGRVCDHRDRVVLADAGVFLPVLPAPLFKRLLADCAADTVDSSGELRLAACRSLTDPANRNLPSGIALAMPQVVESDGGDTSSATLLPLDRIGPSVVGRKPIAKFLLPTTPSSG